MALYSNDEGTIRTLNNLVYNDFGTLRTVDNLYFNDGSAIRNLFTGTSIFAWIAAGAGSLITSELQYATHTGTRSSIITPDQNEFLEISLRDDFDAGSNRPWSITFDGTGGTRTDLFDGLFADRLVLGLWTQLSNGNSDIQQIAQYHIPEANWITKASGESVYDYFVRVFTALSGVDLEIATAVGGDNVSPDTITPVWDLATLTFSVPGVQAVTLESDQIFFDGRVALFSFIGAIDGITTNQGLVSDRSPLVAASDPGNTQGPATWSFDPDIADAVYATSIPTTVFPENATGTQAITQIATAAAALDPNITWNGVVSSVNDIQFFDVFPFNSGRDTISLVSNNQWDLRENITTFSISVNYSTWDDWVGEVLIVNSSFNDFDDILASDSYTIIEVIIGTASAIFNVTSSTLRLGNALITLGSIAFQEGDDPPTTGPLTVEIGNVFPFRRVVLNLGTTTNIEASFDITANGGFNTVPLIEITNGVDGSGTHTMYEVLAVIEGSTFTHEFTGSVPDDTSTDLVAVTNNITTFLDGLPGLSAINNLSDNRIEVTGDTGVTDISINVLVNNPGDIVFSVLIETEGSAPTIVQIGDERVSLPSEATTDEAGEALRAIPDVSYDPDTNVLAIATLAADRPIVTISNDSGNSNPFTLTEA